MLEAGLMKEFSSRECLLHSNELDLLSSKLNFIEQNRS